MKSSVSASSCWRSCSRFRICAWIETSSADTGSSHDDEARARARARARCRCAGAGRRRTRAGSARRVGRQPDRSSSSRDLRAALGARPDADGSSSGSPTIAPTASAGSATRTGPGRRSASRRRSGRSRARELAGDVDAVEAHLRPRSARRAAGGAGRGGRLPAAGLADERRASRRRPSVEVDAVTARTTSRSPSSVAPTREVLREVAHLEERRVVITPPPPGGTPTPWPRRAPRARGSCSRHAAIASGQRGAKLQPAGRRAASGTCPGSRRGAGARLAARRRGSSRGVAARSAARVGMERPREEVAARRLLHDAPRVHHDDARARLGDDAEVVRDEEDRTSRAPAAGRAELQDLRLDRHVERGRRLVGDEQLRAGRRAPPRSSTRWRMPPENWCGYSAARRRGSGMPTRCSISTASSRAARASRRRWSRARLGDLLADRQDRVQRRHRVLEDHRDPRSPRSRRIPSSSSASRSTPP